MIVKSPLKEQHTKTDRRKAPSRNGNGTATSRRSPKSFTIRGNTNGTVYGKRKKRSSAKTMSLPDISAWKVILAAFLIGASGVLYLNHVFATRELLQEVQQMEREYNRAKRLNADYRLTYDRLIGPKEIYQKAKELGFINGGPADMVIVVEED